ncbi:MAG TPA: hypothetical protein VIV60_04610 [Polyangiaceae bacterium]
MTRLAPPIDSRRFEDRTSVRTFVRSAEQRFDRLAFAIKALGLMGIKQTRVAVFPSRRLEVEAGRELGGAPEARWAMVGIPLDASARSIVLALAELARSMDESRGLQAALAAAEHLERAH